MRRLVLGIACLCGSSACGSEIIVGNASGGTSGAGAPGAGGTSSASGAPAADTGSIFTVAGTQATDTGNHAGAPSAAGGATNGGNGTGTVTTAAGAPSAGASGAGRAGAADLPEEVPLTPIDGWISGNDNVLRIQGAVFAFADETSRVGLISDFAGSNACIAGTAARVDINCTPTPPATDCYGRFFGADIGLNLNQPIDPATNMGLDPLEYDARALKGFAFDLMGDMVPAPRALQFAVETRDGLFCTTPATKIRIGTNAVFFSDLILNCYETQANPQSAETVQSALVRVDWRVITNTSAPVPFDFCISNIRALVK